MKTRLAALAIIMASAFGATAQENQAERSAEQQVLDRFLGNWDHEMTARTSDGEITFKRVDTRKWSPDGRYLILENSIDTNVNPDVESLYMIVTYDPESGTYPGTLMSNTYRGLLTGAWDAKTTTMHWKGKDADGENTLTGKHRFLGEDRAEASLRTINPSGDLVLELTYKQTRRSGKPLPPAPTVDELLGNYLEAIGGMEANKKFRTRRTEGSLVFPGVPEPILMVVTQKAPNFNHLKLEIPGLGEHQEGYDGKVAWKSNVNEGTVEFVGEELKTKQRDAVFYQYLDLKSEFKTLTYEGREEVKDVTCDVLKGATEDGREETFYLDARSHLIGMVKRPESTLMFSDYRTVDGIVSPFSVVIQVAGLDEMTLVMKFDKVTHGIEVDDALFAMPKE